MRQGAGGLRPRQRGAASGRWDRRAAAARSATAAVLVALAAAAAPLRATEAGRLPREDRCVGRPVPDLAFRATAGGEATLSALWREQPLMVALVFTRCSGACSPLLLSLAAAQRATGGRGAGYRTLVLSFDPRDTPADMAALARRLGLANTPGWSFGVAEEPDVRRLAESVGFWYAWDAERRQFDHPGLLVAVRDGRVARLLVGTWVEPVRLYELERELRGELVPAYPLPGRVLFRCFEYDPRTGRFALDTGFLVLLAPPALAWIGTLALFAGGTKRRRKSSITRKE